MIPQNARSAQRRREVSPSRSGDSTEIPLDLHFDHTVDPSVLKRARDTLHPSAAKRGLVGTAPYSLQDRREAVFIVAAGIGKMPVEERTAEFARLIGKLHEIDIRDAGSDTESELPARKRLRSAHDRRTDERALIGAIPLLHEGDRARAWHQALEVLAPSHLLANQQATDRVFRPLLATALGIDRRATWSAYRDLLHRTMITDYNTLGVLNDITHHVDSFSSETQRADALIDGIFRLSASDKFDISVCSEYLVAAMHSLSDDSRIRVIQQVGRLMHQLIERLSKRAEQFETIVPEAVGFESLAVSPRRSV